MHSLIKQIKGDMNISSIFYNNIILKSFSLKLVWNVHCVLVKIYKKVLERTAIFVSLKKY